MKWIHYAPITMNQVDGKTKPSEPWISTEEVIRDSGYSRGIKLMVMEVTVVEDSLHEGMLYLHFKGDRPDRGIRIGWLSDEN